MWIFNLNVTPVGLVLQGFVFDFGGPVGITKDVFGESNSLVFPALELFAGELHDSRVEREGGCCELKTCCRLLENNDLAPGRTRNPAEQLTYLA